MPDIITTREFDNLIIVDLPERVLKGGQDIRLKAKLLDVAEKRKNVGVNMKETAYIDSGIVTALLSAEKQISRYGKKLYIINPSSQARELFTITSVNRIIPVIDSEQELQA